jgi:predicted phosphodiesterase
MTKADKAREIIEQFPTLSKKELGKILFKRNPKHFKDAEDGRYIIRAVTGKAVNTYSVTHKDIYIGPNLKEGAKNNFTPFIVKGKNVGLLFDIHFPYHDLRAIELALNYFKRVKVDTIILGGDLIDCYHLSRYEKDPNQRISAWEELRIMMGFLTDLRDNFPNAEIVYKLGNHDERYEQYVKQNCADIFDFPVLSLDYLINIHGKTDEERSLAKKRNVKIVTQKRVLKIGKLNVVHGHEFGKSTFSPVNPARGFYLRAKANTIGGHHHQTSEHIEKDLNNNITGCWSVGCLSDLHPAYMPINKFNLGFARVEVEQGGNFSVENKKIMNYKIV